MAVAAIFLIKDKDAAVLVGISAYCLERGVFGAVIDADDLDIFEGLSKDAFKRLRQIWLCVINGHHNGDGRRVAHFVAPFSSSCGRSRDMSVIA